MSIGQRLGSLVVALFAVTFTRAPGTIRALDPVMRRLLMTRLPAGPNVLLTVRGRTSGRPRTRPVAMLDLGDRGFLQAGSHDVDWVRNLRASGEAVIARGGRRRRFEATELDPETGGRVLHELLERFPSSRLIRSVVGPEDRPPVAVLHYFRVRVDDTVDECIATVGRHPLFELRRPRSEAEAPARGVP